MTVASRRNVFIILILGAMTTISPFSIDMYLPAFPLIADALGTTTARVSLSLSSYLAGLAAGQLFYGPLLDRFGRKRPVYVGLSIYVLASIGCVLTDNVDQLIAFRFLQAIGGCAGGVASMAMVRDFFPAKDTAKIFSLLMLVLSVSPLLAPTLGGVVTTAFGWHGVFIALAVIVAIILAVVMFALPEGHAPDPTFSLRPMPIIENFASILREPAFHTYAFSGALSFSGLLVYVAGSPIVFMEMFHVSANVYGGIFALLSVGFIGGSQVNIALLRKFRSDQIFQAAMTAQVIITACFLIATINGWLGLWETVAFFFIYLSSLGLTNPNAAALCLAPFTKNVGSASSLMGFLQIGLSSLSSAATGLFNATNAVPTVASLLAASSLGLIVLLIGKARATRVLAV
jgi:DHA1 family bicyclomycin/chloramphenicol resistance-like MFS transporter